MGKMVSGIVAVVVLVRAALVLLRLVSLPLQLVCGDAVDDDVPGANENAQEAHDDAASTRGWDVGDVRYIGTTGGGGTWG